MSVAGELYDLLLSSVYESNLSVSETVKEIHINPKLYRGLVLDGVVGLNGKMSGEFGKGYSLPIIKNAKVDRFELIRFK